MASDLNVVTIILALSHFTCRNYMVMLTNDFKLEGG